MKYDIHNQPRLHRTAKNAIAKSAISERNKKIIYDFEKHLTVTGISLPRITRYLYTLNWIAADLGKDFDSVTKDDITDIICALQQKSYSEWTKKTYKSILKRFYKWLKGNDKKYPEEVEWISTHVPRNKRTLPKTEDLLTEEDITNLLNATTNFRDKALVAMLWESGARIGEIGNQEVGSISFDKYGALIMMDGKTGPRPVRLINSVPYVANWLSVHPCKADKHAPLWVSVNGTSGQLVHYRGITKMLEKLFKRAQVYKRYNPHIFRHSRATFLANHLTEFQMNQYFGWAQGSDMPSTYVHLSGKETDKALLKLYGLEASDDKEAQIRKPIKCVRCESVNPAGEKLCYKCGGILTVEAGVEMSQKHEAETNARNKSDVIMNKLMEDPEVKLMLQQKFSQFAASGAADDRCVA